MIPTLGHSETRMFSKKLIIVLLCLSDGLSIADAPPVPRAADFIAVRESVLASLSLAKNQDPDSDESRLLQRYNSVLDILIIHSKELETFRTELKNSEENSKAAVKNRSPVLIPHEINLELDYLERKADFLHLQTANLLPVQLPTDVKTIKPADLGNLLMFWDLIQTEIIDCKIELLGATQDLVLEEKQKTPTVESVKKIVHQSLNSLENLNESKMTSGVRDTYSSQGEVARGSDSTLQGLASAQTLEREFVNLLKKALGLCESITPIKAPNDKAFEQLKTDFKSFTKVVSELRKRRIALAARTVFLDRLTIQELIDLHRTNVPQTNSAYVDSKHFPIIDESLAALDMVEAFLSDRLDEIADVDISRNIFLRFFDGVWNYELTFGEEVSIKLGEIFLLILSVITGIALAFFCSKLVGKFILPWFGIREGVAFAWRLIIRNILALLFIFMSFQIFGVPLTAFAFIGGAAALAIGFGSKDIANNFMSGLIILTEQPVRVNDVIIFDSSQCLVTHIGLRSTRLKNLENYELVVPNSAVIDKMVVNLTLSDNRIRLVLPLEVDRIEDVASSMARMSDALKCVPGVFHESTPLVLLKAVDTYYLNFEVQITIEFEALTDIPLVQSRVLVALAGLFPTKLEDETSSDTDLADDSISDNDGEKSDAGSDIQGSKSMMQRSARDIEHEINILKRQLKTKM